jgi:hypothetical protein
VEQRSMTAGIFIDSRKNRGNYQEPGSNPAPWAPDENSEQGRLHWANLGGSLSEAFQASDVRVATAMVATPVMTAKATVTVPTPVCLVNQVNNCKSYQHH